MASQDLALDFEGHRLVYRVSGEGPAIVVLSQYWRREVVARARLLGADYQLFEITPVGYGRSERVPGYAGERLPPQVLAVLDRHGVDRFVVWGYSAGAAMAAGVARSTPRVAGLISGGFAFDSATPGVRRQLDRRLAPGHPSRYLWTWIAAFDWRAELAALPVPRLLYWGAQDRQMAGRLRSWADHLDLEGIDFVEFAGLDHGGCGAPEALESVVVPCLDDWFARRLECRW